MYVEASKILSRPTHDLHKFDPLITTSRKLDQIPCGSDAQLKSITMDVPKEFSKPWTSLLYKRYERWLLNVKARGPVDE